MRQDKFENFVMCKNKKKRETIHVLVSYVGYRQVAYPINKH